MRREIDHGIASAAPDAIASEQHSNGFVNRRSPVQSREPALDSGNSKAEAPKWADRFWSKVDRRGPDECWPWIAGKVPAGYGHFNAGGGVQGNSHRFAYELLRGPIPPGLQLDHLCRNRACQNPWHMDPVSLEVNVLRGVGITATNARKTHCKRGHLLGDSNVYVAPGTNRRSCRACVAVRSVDYLARARAVRRSLPKLPRKKRSRQTHCHRGHPLSGDNLTSWGKPRCKECRRIDGREYWRRKAAGGGQAVAS